MILRRTLYLPYELICELYGKMTQGSAGGGASWHPEAMNGSTGRAPVHPAGDGAGGEVRYVEGRTLETSGALTDVSGRTDGGRIVVEADLHAGSGAYRASGREGRGGHIHIGAADLCLLSDLFDAPGRPRGGLVSLSGVFRGGAASDPKQKGPVRALGRAGEGRLQ